MYDRRLSPVVARAARAAGAVPGLRGMVEIDDGTLPFTIGPDSEASSVTDNEASSATDYDAALAAASGARDFPPRSADDVYIIYTGGTTGYPKGVMWRHEDIWRTLAGGINFVTAEPLPDEWAQSRKGLDNGEFVKLCAAPLIHGNAQVAALAGLFSGETIVMLPAFDAREIWRAVERHQVNVLVIIGDAMARPLVEAYADGGLRRLLAGRHVLQRGAVLPGRQGRLRQGAARRRHHRGDRLHRDRLRRAQLRERRRAASRRPDRHGRPGRHRDRRRRPAGGARPGGQAGPGRPRAARLLQGPGQTSAMFAEVNGRRYAVPGDMARVEEDGTVTLLGRGNTCVNTGGEKVFPEEVEGALKSHPDVFDALVIGMPDDLLGQRVAALVQPRPGAAPDPAALQEHVRGQIAGYKVPRSIWLTDTIRRTVSGKADYGWAREYAGATSRPWTHAGERPVKTALCDLLGIEHPIVGFTPSEHVAAAVSRAGGLGVLGCVRFNDPAELDAVLDWMDLNTDGRPYGINVVMPARVPAEGAATDLNQLIPQTHKDFVEQTLLRLGVPPLPDDAQAADGVLGWLHSVARKHVEVALGHPARLIANALGPPPPDVIASAHERGMLVAALAGKAEHARRQVASGVDIVVAQGYEAGGHTGEIATMVLVPEIVDAVGAGRAGARRGRDRLRPPGRGGARAGRGRGLDGLGLAAHE